MTRNYSLSPTEVTSQASVSTTRVTQVVSTPEFLTALGSRAPFETGLLPLGVISVRQAGHHLQLVMVAPPAANLIVWGRREHDPNAKLYQLAQPWRVLIGEYHHGRFLGGRMFYSPRPICSAEQPLYHASVPNVNCCGYRHTAVGWVCLYNNDNQTEWTVAERAERLFHRMSGAEAYNVENMSMTDGPHLYRMMEKPPFTYRRRPWETKTAAEGVDWTLDESLWVPVTVTDLDDQDRHNPAGVPLTLGMAMTGMARVNYHDPEPLKLTNALARGKVSSQESYAQIIDEAFLAAKPRAKAIPNPSTRKD